MYVAIILVSMYLCVYVSTAVPMYLHMHLHMSPLCVSTYICFVSMYLCVSVGIFNDF